MTIKAFNAGSLGLSEIRAEFGGPTAMQRSTVWINVTLPAMNQVDSSLRTTWQQASYK